MTCIVAKDGVIAADRKRIGPHICMVSKVWPAKDGSIFSDAGDASWGERFREWYEDGCRPDKRDALIKLMHDIGCDGSALQVLPDQTIVIWESGLVPLPMYTKVYGIGSGSPYALGAVSAGKSLQEAIRIASEWDEYTSPESDLLTLADAAPKQKGRRTKRG